MRKIWVPPLALLSAALGYYAPHTPEKLTLIKFRERSIASIAAAASDSPSATQVSGSTPQISSDIKCRTDVTLDATEMELRLSEFANTLIDQCRRSRDQVYSSVCYDVTTLRRHHPELGQLIDEFAQELGSACEKERVYSECGRAAYFYNDAGLTERADQVERIGCDNGVMADCDNLLQSLGWSNRPAEEQFELVVKGCQADGSRRAYCARIAGQNYSPELFETLKYENNDIGMRLLTGPIFEDPTAPRN